MSEPFIGRKSAIGLGKETTRGTKVAPVVWIPKTSGVLNPSVEKATDDSGYGVIDEVYETFITKNMSELDLNGVVSDDFIGYLLLGALGKCTKCYIFKGTASGGTPKRGDIANTSNAVLKKVLVRGEDSYYFFDKEITGSSITNGTWTISGAVDSSFNAYIFEVAQSNTHPTFTLYDDDPVASSYAEYCMVDSFELSCEVADYIKFVCNFKGKQMKANEDTSITPAYTDDKKFTASMAGVRFADNEAGLNEAGEICMQSFNITINKNLADIQCFGDTDISAMYNQQFAVSGDFEALYNSTTLRDMALDSKKKAIRFYAENTTEENVVSAIYVDLFKASTEDWAKTDANNDIVKQTMGFTAQYDAGEGATIEIMLLNSNSEGY